MQDPDGADFNWHPATSDTISDWTFLPVSQPEPSLDWSQAYALQPNDSSCDLCKEAKIKCDATDTAACSNCERCGAKCRFTFERNRRFSSIHEARDLERELKLANEEINSLRSILAEENFAVICNEEKQISIRQADNVKLLTLVSFFFLPLTFVTSAFWMSMPPGTTDRRFHWLAILIPLLIGLLVLVYVHKTRPAMSTGRPKPLSANTGSATDNPAPLQSNDDTATNAIIWIDESPAIGRTARAVPKSLEHSEDHISEEATQFVESHAPQPIVAAVKQNKARVSCLRCRSRKVKCDGKNPCSGCTRTGAECVVSDTGKKLVVTKSYLDSVTASLDRLEHENSLLRKSRRGLDQANRSNAAIEQRLEPAIPPNGTFIEQVSAHSFNFMRSVQGLVPMTVLRELRPKVKQGFQRLEWRCSCGRARYGDYSKHDVRQTSSLLSFLPGCKITQTAGDNDASQHQDVTKSGNSPNATAASNTIDRMSNASTLTSTTGVTPTKSDLESVPMDFISMRQLPEAMPAFFELCVNGCKTRVCLSEIIINDGLGNCCIKTDIQLFKKIREKYDSLKRKGLYRFLYRPSDIHFVRFGVQRGGYQTGIYQKPVAIPPAVEVKEERYHYYECPLDPLPPIDPGTFFHYFWDHASHPETSGHLEFDTLFFNRLPKKLGSSILLQCDPGKLQVGWGVHIIEGPNKPLLAWLATGILVSSFVISLVYDIVFKNKESGFAIGQWIVAVLTAALTAVYFHLADIA